MIKHTKNSKITVEQDSHSKRFIFLIEGVYYQQYASDTNEEAMQKGKEKLKEILDNGL